MFSLKNTSDCYVGTLMFNVLNSKDVLASSKYKKSLPLFCDEKLVLHSNLVITKLKGDTKILRYIHYFGVTIIALNCNVCHLGVKSLMCK